MPKQLCAHESCSVKLALTSIQCKCEKKFCSTHRYPEDHMCTYDYKEGARKELLKCMSTAIVHSKVEII
ncbi:hypothetical protein EBR66_06355 [bacterium]|nr:hypothetical protein [bacterium]